MLEHLESSLKDLGHKEEKVIEKTLTAMYEQTSRLVGTSLGTEVQVSPIDVQQAITAKWAQDGKRFSDRIWSNKGKMVELVQKGIAEINLLGFSRQRLTKELMKEFDVSFYMADRLVRTELNYVQNKSTLDTFIKANIKKYRILTAEDDRVCPVCEELSTKVFNIEEATFGVNMPPIHPQCRDHIIAVRE